ncbi:MAG: hypothetical protein EOP62_16570 [Sphingomonadales bacterium]|nr:MAG: hypothetical protein EOP62_16570 [Sphingomonadales bacterium]
MRAPLTLLLALSVAGCSGGSRPAAVVESAEVAPVARPMPRPPASASPNLTLPARLADGSYATPNRNLSEAATIWHVRSALNVAVLTCSQGTVLAGEYNQLLRVHRAPLKKAHADLSAEARGTDLDAAMTRVYNYFSQPPAQRDFCPVARALLAEAVVTPPSDLAAFAQAALPKLDAPFTAFYSAYESYRADLALWRAGEAPPQIAYNDREFLSDDTVTGRESVRIATR